MEGLLEQVSELSWEGQPAIWGHRSRPGPREGPSGLCAPAGDETNN